MLYVREPFAVKKRFAIIGGTNREISVNAGLGVRFSKPNTISLVKREAVARLFERMFDLLMNAVRRP